MDVVLKQTGSEGTSWSLKDRLGRTLGTVQQSKQAAGFEIAPVASSTLTSVPKLHATLDEAMTAIAKHMHGECTLDSQDWD
jgi:hypothetical protein